MTDLSKIKFVEKTIVIKLVDFGDFKHPAIDLWETLEAVQDGDVVITDDQLGAKLISLGVLRSLGSNRHLLGASMGDNFDEFLELLNCNAL